MASDKVTQLQVLQQSLQNIILQKQQFESELIELDSACTELEKTDKAYRIVGKIMISTPKEELLKELEDKKEVVKIRLSNISKQEETMKNNIDNIQKEVVAEMQDNKNE